MPKSVSPDAKAQLIMTSSPEEQNFHQLFPEVSPREKLVQSCNCGLMRRKLMRMGRMYVTPLRICFTSSFIEEPLIILLENVLTFERKTSFVFDTIVVVTKARVEYNFTAFISMRVTQMYNLLKTLWSVREKYAADRDSSPYPEPESDASLSVGFVSSPSTSPTSSTANCCGADPRDNHFHDSPPLSSRNRQSTGGKKESDVCTEGNRAAASSPDSQMGTLSAVEKQSTGGLSLERSSLQNRKRLQEGRNDARSGTIPEFRRFFPLVPQTETVKDSFTCCYQFGANRLGKMWVTQSFILFVSPMMESTVEIKFSDVEKIEKEQKLVLLDGFYVQLKSGASMSFSNFTSRDAALNVIESTFQASKAQQKDTPENTEVSGPLVFKTMTCENDENKMPAVASMDALSEVETEYGSALSDFSCFGKEVIAPVKLCPGKGVLDVFGVCFDDGTSLLEDYHTERKDTDQKWEPWRSTKDGGVFRGQRQLTYTTLVKAMMGKPYTCIEYQRYALFRVSGAPTLAVQFSNQVPGVMFGDAFRVEALVTFTQAGSGASTEVTMRVFGYVQFLKSVWVKGRILATTMNTELPDSYKTLANMICGRLESYQSGRLLHPNEDDTEARDAGRDQGAPSSPECRPYAPVLFNGWMLKGCIANVTVLALSALCFIVSLFFCLTTSFCPTGVFSQRGVSQSLMLPLTAVVTAVVCFLSFQIGITAFVSL
ncbi:GRAM domain containing protein, putative [Leishmania tarentolae]|uniref:GRAM domain containing protein, putative n=1 Tax=Leishmania tarentolae TaxID=5689 RepID=A0A640KDG3_LEITA|nr:GRAM domain containing protein, putative [Leishmania tarentolae]